MSIWYDTTAIRAVYKNAPSSEGLLVDLLEIARNDVRSLMSQTTMTALYPDGDPSGIPYTYGNPTADPVVPVNIPASLRMAQLMRVQEVWDGQQINDGGLDPDGTVGLAGYQIRVPSRSTRFKRMVRPDLYQPKVG